MEKEKKLGWYDKSYKWLILVPVIILLISIIYLAGFVSEHGDVILKDVTLTGGTSVTVFDENVDVVMLGESLKEQFSDISLREISEFRTGEQKGFFVETQVEVEEIRSALEEYLGYELNQDNSSVEFSESALSTGFYHQLRLAIFLAFLFMAIVVFIVFRTFAPSLAVILSAFADITMTLAAVDIFGMRLSIAGVIAFLMLIGYSVDTDILLTTRVLKRREGEINERILGSFKTGIMMTLTSMAAIGVSLFIIYSVSEVLRQIFTIVLIGLSFDLINTWFANASILKWYAESKEDKK